MCHKKGDTGGGDGYAVKVVDLRRLHLQPNAEREEKKLSREAGCAMRSQQMGMGSRGAAWDGLKMTLAIQMG